MPDPSDQHIIAKAITGDGPAFRQLVERHQGFVYRLACRFVGTVGDAEDITQEAFIRLWKNLHRYKPEIKVTTWLYKIVTNLCLDFLKSRDNRSSKRMTDIYEHSGIPSNSTTDQPILTEELLLAVERLTAELGPKQKAVFILRDLEEVEVGEIAQILSMDAGQVKSNLYYARRKIGDLINVYYQTRKAEKP